MDLTRRHFLKLAGLGAVALALGQSAPGAAAPARPNILFMMADDLASNELGCCGGVNVKTPAIDALATQGVRFTQCIVSCAMCVPLRASLYTGLYPVHNGVYRNHTSTKPNLRSVAHYMSERGYRVGLTGKQHFSPPQVYPFEIVPGFEPNCTALKADYTLDGIREFMNRKADQPFCLFVCSTNPHAPWTVGEPGHFDPQKLVLPPHWVDTPLTREAFAHYCAEVEALDKQVGDVLKLVDGLGLAENTLVMFSGEQGPQFPRAKWTLYDHGVRSCLLARLPGRIKPGTTTDAIVQLEDVTPTLVDLAGGPPVPGLDGRSFLGVLTGEKSEHRDVAFGVHNNCPEGTAYPIRSIRTRQYKLTLNLTPDVDYFEKHLMNIDRENYWKSWVAAAQTDPHAAKLVDLYKKRPAVELFDIQKDPWEMENLAGREDLAAVRAGLEQRLRAWMAEMNDPGASLDVDPPPAAPAGKKKKAAPVAQKKNGVAKKKASPVKKKTGNGKKK